MEPIRIHQGGPQTPPPQLDPARRFPVQRQDDHRAGLEVHARGEQDDCRRHPEG
jgi:hypothetical protein